MTDLIELRTDGPHSPEYTRQVAEALAEAVRVLNFATAPPAFAGDLPAGLGSPADVYDLLGSLEMAVERMPQLTGQLTAFLSAQKNTGALADDHGRGAAEQVALAAFNLGEAHHAAEVLAAALRGARDAISGLYVKGLTND